MGKQATLAKTLTIHPLHFPEPEGLTPGSMSGRCMIDDHCSIVKVRAVSSQKARRSTRQHATQIYYCRHTPNTSQAFSGSGIAVRTSGGTQVGVWRGPDTLCSPRTGIFRMRVRVSCSDDNPHFELAMDVGVVVL